MKEEQGLGVLGVRVEHGFGDANKVPGHGRRGLGVVDGLERLLALGRVGVGLLLAGGRGIFALARKAREHGGVVVAVPLAGGADLDLAGGVAALRAAVVGLCDLALRFLAAVAVERRAGAGGDEHGGGRGGRRSLRIAGGGAHGTGREVGDLEAGRAT